MQNSYQTIQSSNNTKSPSRQISLAQIEVEILFKIVTLSLSKCDNFKKIATESWK